MAITRCLVVDDDPELLQSVCDYLRRFGLEALPAASAAQMRSCLAQGGIDVVVLDVMLPDGDGLAICAALRQRPETADLPVIMLTALGEESDRVVGLEYGADDYVTKPFSPRELALRVAGVLRRSGHPALPNAPGSETPLADGDLVIDVAARTVTRGGVPLQLTIREFDLLAFFLAHRGQVFTRAELMEQVWGWTYGDQSTVTVHVRRLREKVEVDPTNPTLIRTVWGIGYRLELP